MPSLQYETRTDQEIPDDAGPALPKLGDRWDFANNTEMKRRYPKLFAKYR